MERGRGVKITGGCHCGNIHYELTADVEFEELPVRICSCTFCQKHGNRYTSDPADQSFDMTKAQSFDYSGESAEQSIARREKKWIGNVEIKTLK